jgi:hypothetical protein
MVKYCRHTERILKKHGDNYTNLDLEKVENQENMVFYIVNKNFMIKLSLFNKIALDRMEKFMLIITKENL